MRVGIYTRNSDGSVKIRRLLDKITGLQRETTDTLEYESIPGYTFQGEIDDSLLTDRTFRDAWRFNNKQFSVSLPRARDIILANIRFERDIKLTASDAAYLHEIENGTPQTPWKIYRQALRDFPVVITQELSVLRTETELKNYKPNWPVPPRG